MIIRNAAVFTPEGSFEQKEVSIEHDQFAEYTTDHSVIDGSDCYLIPGLIDIHFHGCAGYDFCDATPESLNKIAAYELKNGITSICPSTMTLPEDALTEICKNAVDYYSSWIPQNTARLCGINLEGPFISAKKKGAQNPDFIHIPDISMFRRLQKSALGLIRLVTLAPELDHSSEFIRSLSKDVRISLGHTDCDYETASAAFSTGARHVTHLLNAMQPFGHRAPGIVGAALDSPDATVELICDGIHIAPSAVRAVFSMFGADRIILVSDSMMATGMRNGSYSLGGQSVQVTDGLATLADGTIAGSATNLMKCMKTAVSMGIPLEQAVKCATINPARAIGQDRAYGSISVGKYADCLLLDKYTLSIQKIFLHGKEVSFS